MYFSVTKSECWKSIFASLFYLSDIASIKWTDSWLVLCPYLSDIWLILGRHLADTWPILDRQLIATYRPTVDGSISLLLVIHWSTIGWLSVVYWLTIGPYRLSVDCPSSIGWLSVDSRQSTDISVDVSADISAEATYSTFDWLWVKYSKYISCPFPVLYSVWSSTVAACRFPMKTTEFMYDKILIHRLRQALKCH